MCLPEEPSFSRLLELAGMFPLKGFRSASLVIMICWRGESLVRMPVMWVLVTKALFILP